MIALFLIVFHIYFFSKMLSLLDFTFLSFRPGTSLGRRNSFESQLLTGMFYHCLSRQTGAYMPSAGSVDHSLQPSDGGPPVHRGAVSINQLLNLLLLQSRQQLKSECFDINILVKQYLYKSFLKDTELFT